MVRLAIHLPYETKIVGSVSYSWMYPIERSLCTLKQYFQNKAHPQGSIIEAYVMNKLGTFCSHYLSGMKTQFTRDEQNDDNIPDDEVIGEFKIFKQIIRSLSASSLQTPSQEEKRLFHRYILNNVDEILEYCK